MQMTKVKLAKVIWRAAWLVPASALVLGSLSFADDTVGGVPIVDETNIT